MKKSILIGCMALAFGTAQAAEWSYDATAGKGGPSEWAGLAPANAACNGKNQSPINLTGFIDTKKMASLNFNYLIGGNEVVNNGHTIQVNYTPGSSITVDDIQFTLKQFHFHAPSENLIDGKSFPMEGHFVHADKDGNLAVVAVMFNVKAPSATLGKIWAVMPAEPATKPLDPPVGAIFLMPQVKDYYRFNGSLTTPPCSEGVRWLVMKTPMVMSQEQLDTFAHTIHHPNNRPVQAVNARPVLK